MRLLLSVTLLFIANSLFSQAVFEGGLTFGGSTSQVRGDNISGFDKFGFAFGGYVRSELDEKKGIHFEILYVQKGSRLNPDPENGNFEEYTMKLSYIEVPLIFEYYLKGFEVDAGIYGSYLVDSSEETQFGPLVPVNNQGEAHEFNSFDAGALLGATYELSEKTFIHVRWTHSLVAIRAHKSGVTSAQLQGNGFLDNNFGQYNSVIQLMIGWRLK